MAHLYSARHGLAAILLVGVLAATGGCTPSTSTATPAASGAGPSATAAPTPTPTPMFTAVPTPVAGPWTPIPASADLATGQRFVAVGTMMEHGEGAFLDSDDGMNWHLQSKVWPNATIHSIAKGPNGFVAVGEQQGAMAAWTSPDGLAWTQVTASAEMQPPNGDGFRTWHVQTVTDGLLAVGELEPPICFGPCIPISGVIWKSTDGLTWKQAPATPAFNNMGLRDIAEWKVGNTTVFITVGWTGSVAAIWTSPDLSTWIQIPDAAAFHVPAGADPSGLTGAASIATTATRVVVVGQVYTQSGPSSAMAWWSADSTKWTAGAGDKFLSGQAFNVRSTPTGFIAVGPSGPPACNGGIWSSPNGQQWTCEADDPVFNHFEPYSVASSPTLEVVVGFGRANGEMTGSGWTRKLTNP